MAYERVNWENLPSTKTPVNADNLNKMDEGIANIDTKINAKQNKLTAGTGIEITETNIINNLNANYSTDEQVIGKWIDGKPLYRKVINATPTISSSSYQTISIKHNISDLKNIHKCNAFIHNTGNTQTYILPTETSATKAIGISEINSTNIIMYSKNDAWSGWIAEITLEYTKTTD